MFKDSVIRCPLVILDISNNVNIMSVFLIYDFRILYALYLRHCLSQINQTLQKKCTSSEVVQRQVIFCFVENGQNYLSAKLFMTAFPHGLRLSVYMLGSLTTFLSIIYL